MSLGKKLQALLLAKDMDQQTLAKKLGVAQSSVSDWVTGKTFPRHSRLKALAKTLGVEVAELLA